MQEGSTFSTVVSCDGELFPYLIGKGGEKKKQIEKETGAQLIFPRRDANKQQVQCGPVPMFTSTMSGRLGDRLNAQLDCIGRWHVRAVDLPACTCNLACCTSMTQVLACSCSICRA